MGMNIFCDFEVPIRNDSNRYIYCGNGNCPSWAIQMDDWIIACPSKSDRVIAWREEHQDFSDYRVVTQDAAHAYSPMVESWRVFVATSDNLETLAQNNF
mgnify:CR=1 FL=1